MSRFTDFALDQDVMSFKDKLESAIADKVGDALAQKKLEVAQTFFDTPVEVEEPAAEVAEEIEQTDEKVINPYAVGMAQAMKSTGDKPPLKKATIKKAHEIAKSVAKK